MERNHPFQKKAVRITSNGLLEGTRIYLPDGTDISTLVKGVRWEIGRDGVATASLELVAATLEVTPWKVTEQPAIRPGRPNPADDPRQPGDGGPNEPLLGFRWPWQREANP